MMTKLMSHWAQSAKWQGWRWWATTTHNGDRLSMTHDMQCNSLLWSSSLDALCVCFVIFFVFMEVFCLFRDDIMQTASPTVLRRGIRAGFYQSEWPTVAQLIQNNDDTLFRRVLSCSNNVLHCLLPDKRSHVYQLRSRPHDCTLSLLPMTIQVTLYIGSFIVTFIDLWQYFLSYLIV